MLDIELVGETAAQPGVTRTWVEQWLPVRDTHGRVTAVSVVADEVTVERASTKEREKLLAESEAARAQVTAVLESISDAFYATDSELCFTYVNRHAEELWGRCRDELIGQHHWTEFPEAVGSESYQKHLQVMEERRPVHFETMSPVLKRWIDVSIYPAVGGGLACYFRDIGEQKAADAERERLLAEHVVARRQVERLLGESERARREAESARREAEAANRSKGEFLAVMSHELRTPLNAISGYAELMELGLHRPVTDQQRADLARIQASQRHLLGLINQVLNYTRIDAGAVAYDLTDVPVGEALAAARSE